MFFWVILNLWPIILNLDPVSSVRVLDFGSAIYAAPNTSLTFAVLTNMTEEKLPDQFILCFSVKQNKLDGKIPFALYGEDKKPWLAFSFWKGSSGVSLWADVQTGNFTKLHSIEKPWTHVWMHLCAEVDTVTGDMAVSLNGGTPIIGRDENLLTNKPSYLKDNIKIGLSKENYFALGSDQFFGFVSNINIFTSNKSQSLESMTSNPCNQGDFMAWSITGLEKTGINLKITEDDDVCSHTNTYDIILPGLASWHEADHQCKGLGQMTKIDDATDLKKIVALVKENTMSCTGVWMPISDEVKEGEFLNTYTQELVTFLPWRKGQPNGGIGENFIALVLQGNASYWDLAESDQLCASCILKTGKSFRLRGLCKGTHLGNDGFLDCEESLNNNPNVNSQILTMF